MERTGWICWRDNFLYGIIITAWFVSAVCGRWLDYAVLRFPSFSLDDRTGTMHTSTEYRYNDKFVKTVDRYGQFDYLLQEEDGIAVPGLTYTNLGDFYSSSMVPQGLCMANDYILVTAYDSKKEANSVIYVIANTMMRRGEYLTTIVLPDKNHVGELLLMEKMCGLQKVRMDAAVGLQWKKLK